MKKGPQLLIWGYVDRSAYYPVGDDSPRVIEQTVEDMANQIMARYLMSQHKAESF